MPDSRDRATPGSVAATTPHPHPTPTRTPAPKLDRFSQARRKLVISSLLFAALLLFGTIGYYLVDRLDTVAGERSMLDAFYFTLVVLTTVGMDGPISPAERYFSIVLMLVGIFIAAAAASNLVAFAVDGELNNYFVRRKLQRMIKELKNHYIVVGFGRMGVALCEELTQQDDPFVLIERDPALAAEAQERGYLTVVGDATHEDILEQAGIHRAAGLTTCLPNDPANVFVTLTARGMRPPTHSPTSHTNSPDTPAAASSPDLEIVARSENPTTEAKLRRAGADRVICPPVISAARVVEMLTRPDIVDLIPATSPVASQLDFAKISVRKVPALIGQTLAQADIVSRTGMTVIAILHDEHHLCHPPPDHLITEQADLVIVGPDGGMDQFLDTYVAPTQPN